MGCGSSSPEVPKARRRLTVGSMEDALQVEEGEEDDRGNLLKSSDVMGLLQGASGRKMSIGSGQDARRESFVDKLTEEVGDKLHPEKARMGFTCRKGLKPESPNQDSWFVLSVEGHFTFYAVFDGHGQKGHDVSLFVKDHLPKLLLMDEGFKKGAADMPALLKDSFLEMQSLIEDADQKGELVARLSGTTATVALHDHQENVMTVAHVADSCAVLGKEKDGVWTAELLTREHKPNLKDERLRIEKAGGRVVFDGYANHRIYSGRTKYPALNMSRSLGDLVGQKCGIIAEPEVMQFEPAAEDKVLLLCSDGVWEFISPLEAIKICSRYPSDKAMQSAVDLAKEAWDRWIYEEGGQVVDDITVVLQYLAEHRGPTVVSS